MQIAIEPLDKVNTNLPPACRIQSRQAVDVKDLMGDMAEFRSGAHQQNPARMTWVLIPFEQVDGEVAQKSEALLKTRPRLRRFFDQFPGDVRQAVLSMIAAGTVLPVHSDLVTDRGAKRPKYDLFNRTLRFHIPVVTNSSSFFYTDHSFFRMAVDELWMVDNHAQHAVLNAHESEDRYHLIFDVEPNQQTLELIKNAETDLGQRDARLARQLFMGSISYKARRHLGRLFR